MDYITFAVMKTIQKLTEGAIGRIKDGANSENDVGIATVIGFYIDNFPEDAAKVPIERLPEIDMEPFTMVKTDNGFYVFNTGVEYSIAKKRRNAEFEDKEDEKRLKKIAETSDEILAGAGSTEEKELVRKMIDVGAIERKPFSLQDMRDKLYASLVGNDEKKEVFIDLTGEKPTKKFLKQLSIDKIRKLDQDIGTNILQDIFDRAEYRPIETIEFSGMPDTNVLTSYITNSADLSDEEKKSLHMLIQKTEKLIDRASEIDVMKNGNLDLSLFGEKEKVYTELKEINSKAEKKISSVENRTFLEENKKIGFFSERSVVKFVCKEGVEDFYTTPTLRKKAALDNAETLSIGTKTKETVVVYGGKKTIQDAALAIESYVSITRNQKERKHLAREHKSIGNGGYAL